MANGSSPKPVIAGVLQGFAQGQQIQSQLANQAEDLKLRKQELDLKKKQIEFQTRQQDPLALFQAAMNIMGGGGQPGAAPGGTEQPAFPMPQPGMEGGFALRAPIQGAPTSQAQGGLQLEGISINREGPTLRLGRPERARSEADRLALSMFGKPFTQLDQSQQGAVLKTEQERKVEVSAAQGAAGLVAKSEAGLDLPLSPEDLGKLILPGGRKLPLGITPRQAIEAGAIPVSAAEQGQKIALEATEKILQRLDSQVNKIFTEEGFSGRLKASVSNTQALLTQQTDAVLYESLKEGVLANMVRTFGERGTLTDQDIGRARNLLPNYAPRLGQLPDTKTAAREKMMQLRELIAEIAGRKPIAPEGAGTPAQAVPNAQRKKLKFNPQTGAIE